MKVSVIFTVVVILLSSFLALVNSLAFILPAGSKKCLKEEVHKDVLVTGEYKLDEAPGQKTHLKVAIADFFNYIKALWSLRLHGDCCGIMYLNVLESP